MNRRFTILIHDHPFLHWDLLVENGDTLLTWRLLKEPDEKGPIPCEPLPDHRRMYLDYEGQVSNDRGVVRQWTTGGCTLNQQQTDLYRLELNSPRIKGTLWLREEGNGEWFCYPPGAAFPGSGSGTDEAETGVGD
ncbi:MAG: hypothetical protein CMJ46_03690 [Planctomyces sp.]|nr:hypothetical protein [Planctomyces sp.]